MAVVDIETSVMEPNHQLDTGFLHLEVNFTVNFGTPFDSEGYFTEHFNIEPNIGVVHQPTKPLVSEVQPQQTQISLYQVSLRLTKEIRYNFALK